MKNIFFNISKQLFILSILFIFQNSAYSQFTISGQFRPRVEFRQGYKSLMPYNSTPAFHVDQRSRLKFQYQNEKIEYCLNLQDVRVWGNTSQLNASDNGLSVHEAWCKIKLNKLNTLKFGRQEIVYDNARIFGNVDWVQQGRKHDLLLYSYEKKIKLDFGLAYNSSSATLSYLGYTIPNNYKALMYGYFNWKKDKIAISSFMISTGRESEDTKVLYVEETSGILMSLAPVNSFGLDLEAYYQFGKDNYGLSRSAYLLSFSLSHELNKNLNYRVGADVLSGTSDGTNANSFDPLFGTHHKFYGHMDYFYVGNSHGNLGLHDYFLGIDLSLKKNHKLLLTNHVFSSNQKLLNNQSYLGFESDLIYKFPINEYCNFSAGYSVLIADENMREIKSGDHLINHWGWVMIDVNSSFFNK